MTGSSAGPQGSAFEPLELGCSKILLNKLRNLKKAIEKANHLEEALQRGESLNDQQLESVRTKELKSALVRELEEVHKKQTVVFKKEKENVREKLFEDFKQSIAPETKEEEVTKPEVEEETPLEPEQPAKEVVTSTTQEAQAVEGEQAAASYTVHPEPKPEEKPGPEVTQELLNLLHVADRINHEKETVKAVLEDFERNGKPGLSENTCSEQDLKAITYFAMMLTTPDGVVPLNEAVRVSSFHAENYIKRSAEDAFPGCTYESLASLVSQVSDTDTLQNRNQQEKVASTESTEDKSKPVVQDSGPAPTFNFFAQPEASSEVTLESGMTHQGMGLPMRVENNQLHGGSLEGLDVVQSSHAMQSHLQAVGMQYVGSHPTAGPMYSPPMAPGYIIQGPMQGHMQGHMPNYYSPSPMGVVPPADQRRGSGRGQGRGGGSSGSGRGGRGNGRRDANGAGGARGSDRVTSQGSKKPYGSSANTSSTGQGQPINAELSTAKTDPVNPHASQ
uniref:Caprin-1 dimerization domain-containing protein n=1 Tax=Rhodosorus marinus TaxID=101924 RepID=A0A7S3EAJ0_9RHOD|mmetsp:Transcript_18323/g.73450  ORF Transcript_18323/g.73450 Transcript_18323/m.73450 type:complete len:504 (+) Transcript_18323:354-1865(+)|eukprot:CAMPEP_0113972968 /NCGR_PEP_ID=MMETSP0011_2-20120614/13971_1 /TAXON_ID=101924 /ORGANISM="Rhodosorus marinus" /LENGTH=503 /DNA_ID=CAMNT_0000990403 /DNA_START=176 /DNA_END=1687 /DNA_ORIENTATION=+ /assembly_acc=CAM_ASM_000156